MSLIKLEEMLQLHMFPWLSRCPSTTCLYSTTHCWSYSKVG